MLEKDWDRLAKKKEYLADVISPFAYKSSAEIIEKEIRRFANKNKTAIDLGTGLGILVPFLSRNFREVFAIDYSSGMVDFAKQHNKHLKNAVFEKMNMLDMPYKNKFDAAIAINSIIAPSIKSVTKIIKNIHKLLKKNGTLIAVLPSLEAILYCAMLVNEKKLKTYSEKTARKKTRQVIEGWCYDFLLGFMKEGKEVQKHFYDFEIEYRLKKAGFKDIEIKKIHYPWKVLEDKDRNFPGEEPVWDWLVVARK